MSLIRCLECNREISDKAQVCPGCGAPVPAQFAQPSQSTPIGQKNVGCGTVIGVLAALGVIFVAALMMINPEDPVAREKRYKAQTAIEICWQDYEKKSLDPQTKRFIASVCEKLESDFKQVYGRDP